MYQQKVTGYTYFNDFVFNGKSYPLNTIVCTKKHYVWTHQIGDLRDYKMVQVVESYLDWQKVHRWTYALWKRNGSVITYTTSTSPDEIIDFVVRSSDTFKEPSKKAEYYKDSESPAVMRGWVIYIVCMLVSLIFKQWYVARVWGSLYFFIWRAAKLRKPEKIHFGVNAYEKEREWNGRK